MHFPFHAFPDVLSSYHTPAGHSITNILPSFRLPIITWETLSLRIYNPNNTLCLSSINAFYNLRWKYFTKNCIFVVLFIKILAEVRLQETMPTCKWVSPWVKLVPNFTLFLLQKEYCCYFCFFGLTCIIYFNLQHFLQLLYCNYSCTAEHAQSTVYLNTL